IEPVGGAQFASLAAHGFADVHHFDRPGFGLAVKGEGAFARPEVLERAEAEARVAHGEFSARHGGTPPAWSGGLPHARRARLPIRAATASVPGPAYSGPGRR